MKKLRFGILGAANIAQKNWKSLWHSGNCTLVGVATREPARAADFIQRCQSRYAFEPAPKVFASYDALLSSPDIDAVYIPLPTGLRKEWVIRAAKAGKHILSEKPSATNVAELREILDICQAHKVQYLDGVMFMHCTRLPLLRAALDDRARFGEIRRINSNFSFVGGGNFLQQDIRTNRELEPLGCLGDLGWYCLRFSLWAMNWQRPIAAIGNTMRDINGVPIEFSGELHFAGGVSASFYCSFIAEHQQLASVIGTKASIEMADFVLPFNGQEIGFVLREYDSKVVVTEWTIHARPHTVSTGESGDDMKRAQESLMFRNFADQVFSGKPNNDWPAWALLTQEATNACFSSAQQGGRKIDL